MKQFPHIAPLLLILVVTACNPVPAGYDDLYGSAKEITERYYPATSNEQTGVFDFDPSDIYLEVTRKFDRKGNCIYRREKYSKQTFGEQHSKYDSQRRLVSHTHYSQDGSNKSEMVDSLIHKAGSNYTYLRFDRYKPGQQDTLKIKHSEQTAQSYLNGNLIKEIRWNKYQQPVEEIFYKAEGEAYLTKLYHYELKSLLSSETRINKQDTELLLNTRYAYLELDKYGNWTQAAYYYEDKPAFLVFREITY
ncbi:MAG: hypothetical protein ACRC9P_00360 [Bacteroides sp.]